MSAQADRGTGPWSMSAKAWFTVLKATWREAGQDNIGLIASGVAFYGFLAIVPLLGAVVLSYGIIAEPSTVMRNMTQLTSVMPADAAKLIGEQLLNVVKTSDGKKGFGLLLALGLALFGARNGAGAVITALNIAYDEDETRSFVRVNLLALAITAVAVGVAIVALVAIAALGHLESAFPNAPEALLALGKIVSYLAFTLAGAGAAATLYRFGPARSSTHWVWLTPGSALAAVLWLGLTIGFGVYVANFGNYNATYGSLGAVVVLMTWLSLSTYILLFGAELNAELEKAADPQAAKAEPSSATSTPDGTQPVVPQLAPAPLSRQPTVVQTYVTGRAANRIGHIVGLHKVGMASSAAATVGLSLLRREGRGLQGMALLSAVAGIAWLTRERRASGTVQAVLFDIDGTLVDSNDLHVEAWNTAFHDAGHAVDRAAIHSQIGKGGDLLVPALLPGTSEREQKALAKAHGDIFQDRYLDRVRPFPGAADLLRHVHASGRRVVLASSAARTEVEHYVTLLEVTDIVDATTTIDDVATSKPAGDIFAAALSKLKSVSAAEALVVGDTPYDIEAARKCGIATIAVRSGGTHDAALRGAAWIYDDVAALLKDFARSPIAT